MAAFFVSSNSFFHLKKLFLITKAFCPFLKQSQNNMSHLFNVKINDLAGNPMDLSLCKGKHVLFVNVASECGFTPQYKNLQQLSSTYKEQLIVIGVPCNQFGKQEPGTASEISNFCEINYGVTFLITEKIDIKGANQHPLYEWLTKKELNGVSNSSVKWNFQKYLINPEGQLIDYYYSITKPSSKKITKHLKQKQ